MATDGLKRVLVLEDEWIIAELLTVAIEDAGYAVVGPASRVDEALLLLANEHIDAALIDINVNGERSFGLAQKLVDASIPFAFLSGYSGIELPAPLRGRPLMQKPVNAVDIGRRVDSLLASS